MQDPAADAARSYDHYQQSRVALAARIARTYGPDLHSLDAEDLAARDIEFASVWRHGQGETEAEDILCRALEMGETVRS